jgi:hypothetical protein
LLIGDGHNDPEAVGFEGQELILTPHDIKLPLQAALRHTEALDLNRHILEFGVLSPLLVANTESAAASAVVEVAIIS